MNNGENSDTPLYALCNQLLFESQINWDGKLLRCCILFKDYWNMNVFDM